MTQGKKFDAGKSPVTQSVLHYFPQALLTDGGRSDMSTTHSGTAHGQGYTVLMKAQPQPKPAPREPEQLPLDFGEPTCAS